MNIGAIQSAQKTIRVIGVALMVIGGIGGTVVIGPALGGGTANTQVHAYNVTFIAMNGTGPSATGSGDYFSTVPVSIGINMSNLTVVTFTVSFQDNSLSPLTNPAVTVTISGPNGTGTSTGSANSAGVAFPILVNNIPPANATVDASSEGEAIAKAAGNMTDGSLGSGDWTVTLDIGATFFGRIRPQSSITYSIEVAFEYFEGKATTIG